MGSSGARRWEATRANNERYLCLDSSRQGLLYIRRLYTLFQNCSSRLTSLHKSTTLPLWDYIILCLETSLPFIRVPTPQGKQGKWQKKFPVRENTGNLKILPKHREFAPPIQISSSLYWFRLQSLNYFI